MAVRSLQPVARWQSSLSSIILFFIPLLCCFGLVACQSVATVQPPTGQTGTSSTTGSLGTPIGSVAIDTIPLGTNTTLSVIPPELTPEFLKKFGAVGNIRLTVSGSHMKNVQTAVFQPQDIQSSQRLIIQNIPAGTVNVLLEVLNQSNVIIYSDTKTVNLQGQQTNPVAFTIFVPGFDLNALKGILSVQPSLVGTGDLSKFSFKLLLTSPYLPTPQEIAVSSGQILSHTPILVEQLPAGNLHVRLEALQTGSDTMLADEKIVMITPNETTFVPISFQPLDTLQNNLVLNITIRPPTRIYGELVIEPTTLIKAGETVTIKVVNAKGSICHYNFNFGDGSPPFRTAQPVVKHTYNQAGDAKVTVDLEGCFGDTFAEESALVAKGVDPLFPALPANLKAVSINSGSITVEWDPSDRAETYNLYRDTNLVKPYVTETKYTFTGLNQDTLYVLGVNATNKDGETEIVPLNVRTAMNGGSGGGGGGGGSFTPPAPPPPVPPTISGLSVLAGNIGDIITINGTGLDASPAVTFNGVPAVIVSVAATALQVTIPEAATTGPITVTTIGGSSQSPVFTVNRGAVRFVDGGLY